jgi:DNA-binding NtrC family response regulator
VQVGNPKTVIWNIPEIMKNQNLVRILIVDDEPAICNVFEEFLAQEGYDIDTAYSGEEALEILTAQRHDLVLLDLKMPGMGGLEVLKEIRKRSYQVGVVVITGVHDLDLAREVQKQGALDYLNKPIDLKLIASTVCFALKKQRIIKETAESNA